MYIPAHFAADPAEVDELLAKHGAADLITLTDDGLLATMLPFAYEPSARPVSCTATWPGTTTSGAGRPGASRWPSSAAPTRTCRRPGTRPRPNTAESSPPGTTSRPTSTASSSCTTTPGGSKTWSAA